MNDIITKELLEEYGIDTTGKDVTALLAHLNDTLKERVGAEIAESLDETQLEQLVALQAEASDEEVGEWLSKNIPELQEITQDEIDILLGEISENSEEISAAA